MKNPNELGPFLSEYTVLGRTSYKVGVALYTAAGLLGMFSFLSLCIGSYVVFVISLIPLGGLGVLAVRQIRTGLGGASARLHEGGIVFRNGRSESTLLWSQVRSITYERIRFIQAYGPDGEERTLTLERADGARFKATEPGAGTIYAMALEATRSRLLAEMRRALQDRQTLTLGPIQINRTGIGVHPDGMIPWPTVRTARVREGILSLGDSGATCEIGQVPNAEVLLTVLQEDFQVSVN